MSDDFWRKDYVRLARRLAAAEAEAERLRNVQMAGWERAAKAEERAAAADRVIERLCGVIDTTLVELKQGNLHHRLAAERLTYLLRASSCTCEQGDDDCIPCGSPGDATGLCDTCLSYADVEVDEG